MNLISVAQAYLKSGLSVLPADPTEKRPTLSHWKIYQQRLPTADEAESWFAECRGLCLVTGKVSGNLELLDFDGAGELFSAWYQSMAEQNSELLDRLVVERSQSNGLHAVYRSETPVCGSIKLAQRLAIVPDGSPFEIAGKTYVPRRVGDQWAVLQTLIETRGEKGLFLCDPSPGYELQQGRFEALPVLTPTERDLLLARAWELTEYHPQPEPEPEAAGAVAGRPGDDFNARGDHRALLQQHGWQLVRGGKNEYWRRPGKLEGWSATLKDRDLYVFSSNAAPFEPERAYSPFGVYSLLEHNGDFGQAAAALSRDGYGHQPSVDGTVNLSRLVARHESRVTLHETEDGPLTRLIARRVSDVKRETLQWLWPGRIPLGKLTLLAGDPGLGKSMVSIDITARVSRGGSWPDNSLMTQPVGTVIMFNAEDDLEDTIAPRLDAARADDRQIIAVEGVEAHSEKDRYERTFTLQSDLPRLEELLDVNPDTRLVVVDPISAYCGNVDTHKNSDVRSLLAPLAQLAGRRRIAVVAITHLTKGVGSKAVYRAMGSLAFAAAARAVWTIVQDADDRQRRLLLPAKLNLAHSPDGLAYRIKESCVVWDADPIPMHADDAFAAEVAAQNGRGTSKRATLKQEAMEWLQSVLTDVPRSASEIAEEGDQSGFDKRTLQRAYKALGGVPQKDGFDGGWVWSLPGSEPVGSCEDDRTPFRTLELSSSA
ncbi:MAG: hypothetical protein DWQ34_15780 [Planctomycetota bacterium]|nr:MAG: hypothetical protein DWQ34_15780 [Planctomycetota bacterium]REK20148.1 MAG: hypothetical protein DWQ41_26250 [Planctomycetota bacterium]REK32124.1 MAG: hypothetical protein DWQ45_17780 [Planctomycetota bacterium]